MWFEVGCGGMSDENARARGKDLDVDIVFKQVKAKCDVCLYYIISR